MKRFLVVVFSLLCVGLASAEQMEGVPPGIDLEALRQKAKAKALQELHKKKRAEKKPAVAGNMDRRVFTNDNECTYQFSNFRWGMTTKEALAILRTKGKLFIFSKQGSDSKYIEYNDTLFEIPCKITLTFTLMSDQLAQIFIKFNPYQNWTETEAMFTALIKKYGKYDEEEMTGWYVWGDDRKKGANYLSFDTQGGTLYYHNGKLSELMEKEYKATIEQKAEKGASEL